MIALGKHGPDLLAVVYTWRGRNRRIISASRAAEVREKTIRRYSSLDDIPKGRTDWKRVRALSDEEIKEAIRKDPDAARILDKEWFRKARIVIPEKTPITIRLDRDIIEWFKKQGKGYQTRINAVLRAYVESRH